MLGLFEIQVKTEFGFDLIFDVRKGFDNAQLIHGLRVVGHAGP